MSLRSLPSYVLNISDTGPYRISNDNIVKNKIRLALLLNAIDGRLHHNYSYTHVKINDNIYDLDNTRHVNDLKRYIEHHIGSHPSFFARIKDVPALAAYRRFLEDETARAYHVPDGFQERTRRPDITRASPVSESEIIPQLPIVIPEQPQLVIPGADYMTPQQIQAVLRGSPRIPNIRWADYSDDDDDDEDLYAGKRKSKKSKKSKKPKKRPKSKKKKYRKKKNKTASKK